MFSAKVPELLGLVSTGTADEGVYYGTVVQSEQSVARGRLSQRPLGTENSMTLTAGILVAEMVGGGVLSMGFAIARLGWFLGGVAIIAMLCMNAHLAILVWRVHMAHPSAHTSADLASAVFANSPDWQRRLAESITFGFQQSYLFMALTLYSLSVGKGLGMLFYNEMHLCLPLLVLLALVVFSPVQLTARHLGKHYPLVALNVLVLLVCVLVPLVRLAFSGVENTRPPGSIVQAFADFTVTSMMSGLLVVNFSFGCQCTLVEVIAEMRDPTELPQALLLSFVFAGMLYLISGIGAYYLMGSAVQGIVVGNLPFGPTFRVAAACMMVHMLISVLICGTLVCRGAQQVWNPSGLNDTSLRGWGGWCTTVGACMGLSWLVGQVVPFFTDFVDLVGASLNPVCCLLFPIMLYAKWTCGSGSKDKTIGILEATALVLEVALSMTFITFGTYNSAVTIVGNWHTYGMPFDCHCESLRATCECSANHAGMEHCLART